MGEVKGYNIFTLPYFTDINEQSAVLNLCIIKLSSGFDFFFCFAWFGLGRMHF